MYILRRESKDEALKMAKILPEIMNLYGVKTDVKIPNPRNVFFLRLLVKGEFIKSDRQLRLGDTLLIQTIGPTLGRPMNEYLEATPFIQSKDKRIIDLANKIVGNIQDPWKQSRELVSWVAEKVKDMPTVSIPSALDVLETLEGDCGEHTVLFVALARALGIPAQIMVGLVYVGDGFYYHAWAKVWAGRWVEVDPTFGQSIADATHIALAEGELGEQAKIMKLVDQIELKVLEYK
jgi:transglutaminase-like putative cysteine protease